MAARIQPQNIGTDANGASWDPYRITGSIPADKIDDFKKAYLEDQRANRPGNFDNEGNFDAPDPIYLKSDGTYGVNPNIIAANNSSDRYVEIEQAPSEPWNRWGKDNSQVTGSSAPTTKRVPAWQAMWEDSDQRARRNFEIMGGSLAWLQKGGLESINAMVNQAYSRIA